MGIEPSQPPSLTVATVLKEAPGAKVPSAEVESAAFIAVLNGALHMHQLVPAMSTMNALWSTINHWQTRKPGPRFEWIRLVREASQRS